ncbi:MAG: PrsW family glutamic-type intramembrane protease [Anaerolineales bacterium]|nr:PrsW family glutamic-type intramembrane protease [Anaerolineales bacterium]
MNHPAKTTARSPADWLRLAVGLFLTVSSAVLIALSFLLVFFGAVSLFLPGTTGASSLFLSDTEETLVMFLSAAGTFVLGLLLLPGAFLNFQAFFSFPVPRLLLPHQDNRLALVILFMLWFLCVASGYALTFHQTLSLLLLPFLNTGAVLLSVVMVLIIALQKLPLPSPRRAWSLFGVSALLGPTLAIFFELFAFLGFMVLFTAYVSSQPALELSLHLLLDELENEAGSLDFATQQMATLLLSPGVGLLLFGLLALMVPIIEEAFKVSLLWGYAGKLRSPAEGFVAGVLCGAAFALVENIGFSSAGASDWLLNILTRSVTALPHAFNSGLVGWGLVLAWQRRDYLRLGLAYLAAVLIHGTWNGLSFVLVLNSMAGLTAAEVYPLIETPLPALAALFVLTFGIVPGLLLSNRQVRRQDGV